jgi:oligopeptide transport system substrate-binding protein
MGLQKIAYFKDHAIAEAKNLLKKGLSKKGYSLDKFQEITLTYANNEKSHLIAQTVQEQWKEAFGVKVKLEPLEFKIFFDRVAKEDFLLATGSWTADFNDPVNFLEVFKFKKASTNNTHWENSRYIELLDSSSQVSNKEERLAILSSSEALLMDEMPIIPIFHYTMRYLKEDRLKDVVLSSLGNIDFKWAYWDEEEK